MTVTQAQENLLFIRQFNSQGLFTFATTPIFPNTTEDWHMDRIGSVIKVQLEQQKWSLSDHAIKRRKYTYTQVFGVYFFHYMLCFDNWLCVQISTNYELAFVPGILVSILIIALFKKYVAA